MYDSYMKEYPVSTARERLAEIIDEVQRSGDPIQLTKRGRVVAVLIDPDSFEKLSREAEDAFDRAALALSEDDDDFIPWDEVKNELGLA